MSTPFEEFRVRLETDPNARPFVPARRPRSVAAQTLVANVQSHLQSVRRWRRQAWRTRAPAIEALACDLLHRWLTIGNAATIHASNDQTVKLTRYTESFTGRPQREALAA